MTEQPKASVFNESGLDTEKYNTAIHATAERIFQRKLMKGWIPNYIHSYFDGHKQRFLDGVNMMWKNCRFQPDDILLEYGSTCPYFTLPFVLEYGCSALIKDISLQRFEELPPRMYTEHGNIVTDSLPVEPQFSLIVMSEVWEHLPCSLLDVKAKVLGALKSGGWLYCSYPLKGVNSDPSQWGLQLASDIENDHGHLREFTEQTAEQFVTEIPIISSVISYSCAYGGSIKGVLYRKP